MKTNLIIQMHRLGDLVMSFPLIQKLKDLEPERPLWVVAEPHFYNQLEGLVPNSVFLSPDEANLQTTEYNNVYNISQRQEAAELMSSLKTEDFIGEIFEDDMLVVKGFWQIYRTSLRQNSRHNLFHWADMHALDILDYDARLSMQLGGLNITKKSGKVGLFLGASSPLKRPDPAFFASLAEELMKRGLYPVFLGGEREIPLGAEASQIIQSPLLDLTGKFSLNELVHFMQDLDLLITPDTGPMHIAGAAKVPTLTLSMGNVNPYETSVMQSGHYILQANMSCVSCWDCDRQYQCKEKFEANKVVAIAHAIIEQRKILPKIAGLKLFRTEYNNGLHELVEVESRIAKSGKEKESRYALDHFWRDYFLSIAPLDRTNPRNQKLKTLAHVETLKKEVPHMYARLVKAKLKLFMEIEQTLHNRTTLDEDFWKHHPPLIRIFASFVQVYLENYSYSMQSYMQVFNFFKKLDLR